MDSADLQQWVNRTEVQTDEATLAPAVMLAATLGLAESFTDGCLLPPLWHWLYFLPKASRTEIGSDGHPKRGGFLPPVTLPRRMWAGSRLQWERELRIGDKLQRKSTIESVESKSGRSGQLVFVRVRHEIAKAGEALALTEWQDIVYREPSPAQVGAPTPIAVDQSVAVPAQWCQAWHPDPMLLFRFSALTFNGHRIHYDRPYATGEEGYPGLVVHGPLLAILMMQLATTSCPARGVRSFQFRGLNPVIDTRPFNVCGNPGDGSMAELFVEADGIRSTEARVNFRDQA